MTIFFIKTHSKKLFYITLYFNRFTSTENNNLLLRKLIFIYQNKMIFFKEGILRKSVYINMLID